MGGGASLTLAHLFNTLKNTSFLFGLLFAYSQDSDCSWRAAPRESFPEKSLHSSLGHVSTDTA